MQPADIARVETYLRKTVGSDRIRIVTPTSRGGSIEVWAGGEFLGTVHRDDEDGEVSYSVQITILRRGPAGSRAAERCNGEAEVSVLLHGVGDQFQQFLPIDRLASTSMAPSSRASAAMRASGNPVISSDGMARPVEFSSRSKASPVISGIF